ncbi:UNVERIFIED_CONTAM: Purple acid phosphatase 2 [Sesamum radiatum]|uniref:Purple acid phosphatase n=1 Tax=Sesamum radiatum TaxID=300843 RepID=A0AAW2M2R6_SESRA
MGVQFNLGRYVYLHVGFIFLGVLGFCEAGLTSSYLRNNGLSRDMPLDSDVFKEPPGYNAPQQVHITQGDHEGTGVIVSWVTPDEPGSNSVLYWAANSQIKKRRTVLLYSIRARNVTRQFWFVTPPQPGPDVPYTFGLIGDLGQTCDSNRTLTHYELNPVKGQTLLFVGDLSYADSYPLHDNTRWDTWGRFIERSAAYQPWIWTAGNHEIDFVPEIGETKPFKPYKHRFFVPYRASQSTSPLWYSIKRASAYIIVISSYSAYGKYTPQNKWIENELPKVNRTETPWLIVLMHCPMYSSYVHHYMEGETMRVMYEPWFVKYKVDVVFAGHVHAYERSERISNIRYDVVNGFCTPVSDDSAPVYITIGDGGNQEGLVKEMTQPQPEYSAYREASYGHGIFDIKNRTHAYFGWHRNQDGFAVEADSLWFVNRYWKSIEETSVAVK